MPSGCPVGFSRTLNNQSKNPNRNPSLVCTQQSGAASPLRIRRAPSARCVSSGWTIHSHLQNLLVCSISIALTYSATSAGMLATGRLNHRAPHGSLLSYGSCHRGSEMLIIRESFVPRRNYKWFESVLPPQGAARIPPCCPRGRYRHDDRTEK